MKSSPKISLIIVSYNGKRLISRCLASLKRQKVMPFETIVVDNASKDGTVEHIRRNFPFVKLMPLEENTGFAGGNNAGIAAAKGEYIMLLNPDTAVAPDCIQQIERALAASDAHVGAWALKLVSMETNDIDTLGFALAPFQLAYEVKDERKAATLHGPSGGAAVFRKKALEEVKDRNGYFDKRLFMYNEDVDLAIRVRERGWRLEYIPVAVRHLNGGSTKDHRTRTIRDPFIYMLLRNRILVYKKKRSFPLLALPYLGFQSAIFVKYLLKGKGRLAYEAIRDGFLGKIRSPEKIFARYG